MPLVVRVPCICVTMCLMISSFVPEDRGEDIFPDAAFSVCARESSGIIAADGRASPVCADCSSGSVAGACSGSSIWGVDTTVLA